MASWPSHSQPAGRENFEVDIRYTNFEPIGDGSYGFVCSADDNATGKRVAVKKVKDIFRNVGDAKRILRELKLLRHFRPHENVVTILDIMVHPKDTMDFRDVYIVTNLMESDLQKVISSTQPLTDQHFHYFLYQLLRGLKYIHSANVLHRDLKPSNLVLNANCDLAICDFGLARGVEEDGETLTEYVQTRWYRAPELLCYASFYGMAVDMWSVGCIFAELLARKPFFQGKNPMHQLKMIVDVLGCPSEDDLSFIQDKAARAVVLQQARQSVASQGTSSPRPLASYFPPGTSDLAIDLLSKMLVFNPDKRICVEEALEHPYLRDLHTQMLDKEPVCPHVFDFDFEKEGGRDANGFHVPKQQRKIPIGILKALVLEEMLAYRPSPQTTALMLKARQSAEDERRRVQQRRGWGVPGALRIPEAEARDFDNLVHSAEAAARPLTPMDGGDVSPGMTTPTPGMHGYPGAMAYSSAVPERMTSSAASSLQARGFAHQQQLSHRQHHQHQHYHHSPQPLRAPPPMPRQYPNHYQHHYGAGPGSRGGGGGMGGGARASPSPEAVAAAIATATAASAASSSGSSMYPNGSYAFANGGAEYGRGFNAGGVGDMRDDLGSAGAMLGTDAAYQANGGGDMGAGGGGGVRSNGRHQFA